jgi:hypothetical protein
MVTQFVVFCVFFTIMSFILNISIHKYFSFNECVFLLISQVALNELEPNSIDIMCLIIIDNILIVLVNMNYCH